MVEPTHSGASMQGARVVRGTAVARGRVAPRILAAAIAVASIAYGGTSPAEPVAVRHAEGLVHGFLVLRTLDGALLADGDLIQTARGFRVTSRLVFHFKDGSLSDETTVFLQQQQLKLVSDHLIQKGPAFPQPIDMSIDAGAGQVTVRYTDDHGAPQTASKAMNLPPDVANGLVLTALKNADPAAPPRSLAFVASTPKPMLVKLAIAPAGEESFSTAGTARKAIHYILKVDIGGLKGAIAPLVGKQPPDSHVWILGGEAPAFVKAEQPLYTNGPVWRIELVSPIWPGEGRRR